MIVGIVIELVYGYLHSGCFLLTFTRISINDCPNDGGVLMINSSCSTACVISISMMGEIYKDGGKPKAEETWR